MDKLKYIRVQQQGGTYSSDIPIAADANNISMLNGHDLQETLGDLNVTNADDVTTQLSSLHSSVNSLNQQKVNHTDLSDYIDNQLAGDVTSWLANNVSPTGSTVSIDKSLKIGNSAADAKVVGDLLYDANSHLLRQNQNNNSVTINGVTISTPDQGETWYCNGTLTSSFTAKNLIVYNSLPEGMHPGDTIYIYQDSSNFSIFRGQIYYSTNNGSSWSFGMACNTYHKEYTYKIPNNCNGLLFRINAIGTAGQSYNNVSIKIKFYLKAPNYNIPESWVMDLKQPELSNGTNLNDITQSGIYRLMNERNYINTPLNLRNESTSNSISGLLIVYNSRGLIFQLIYNFNNNSSAHQEASYIRKTNRLSSSSAVWSEWLVLSPYNTNILYSNPSWGLNSCDLDAVVGKNQLFLLFDSETYQHSPIGNLGFFINFFTSNWNLQIAIPFNANQIYLRRGNVTGSSWTNWNTIAGSGGTTTNEYTFNEYQNTYNITTTPSITTDTNSYLASTNNTTDRTADIIALLNSTGVCRLGKGTYYVNNLQMPNSTSIIGAGNSTKIIMSGTSAGHAIKMKSDCLIENVLIKGSTTDLTLSDTVGNRHGILWQGNYTAVQQEEASNDCPLRSIISNVWIEGFTGGGITCYDTGYGSSNCLEVTNVYLRNCTAGINISYWSEFNKFTNVRAAACYYGCINNGGNNVFTNCDFSSSVGIGMLMDNSQNQSPNNTHGSCVGCVFNHTASNTGTGIKILNCESGFMFTGCQIFFSKIQIDNSPGIVFNACDLGYNNCNIIITGSKSKSILFSSNIFQDKPPISSIDASALIFVNNYNRTTGNLITL